MSGSRKLLPPGPVTVLRGHNDSVNSITFLSSSLFCSGGVDGVLKIWNLRTRRPILSFDGHSGESILSLCPQYGTDSVLSCGRDGFVKVWKVDNEAISRGNCEAITSIHTGSRHFCNASWDRFPHSSDIGSGTANNLVATPTSEESEIAIWDLRDLRSRVATIGSSNASHGDLISKDKHGMLCSLLLQSCRGVKVASETTGELTTPSEGFVSREDDSLNELTETNSAFTSLFAGYEDGSISCFDIRTFR